MTTTVPSPMRDNPDFATLDGQDEYAEYFNQLCLVVRRLLACYDTSPERDSYEQEVMSHYLRRLLYTIEVLRIKYTYKPSHDRSLWVDLSESGFPNCAEFRHLQTELTAREHRLRRLPPVSVLKQAILDHMCAQGDEPGHLLGQLSERTYLQMLDEQKLYLPFTPGSVERRTEDAHVRNYVFSWGCYDFQSNRPYIHLMTFEQDASAQRLDQNGPERTRFLEVMEAEGSRAPDVGVLALAVDDALETVHPKIIKRICVGPLYSRLLQEDRDIAHADPRAPVLCAALAKYARRTDDFLLFYTDEIVFSKRQEVTRSLFAPMGKVREIFAIHEMDPDCYLRRASLIHRHVLLPHVLLQHLGPEEQSKIPELEASKKLAYDEKGDIHGI